MLWCVKSCVKYLYVSFVLCKIKSWLFVWRAISSAFLIRLRETKTWTCLLHPFCRSVRTVCLKYLDKREKCIDCKTCASLYSRSIIYARRNTCRS
jgi:hypothetical protein